MFKNLFGKKNGGFFMQADEIKPTPAKSVAPETKIDPQEAAQPAAATASEAPISTEAPTEQVAPKSGKTSIKSKKESKGTTESQGAGQIAPAVLPVAAASAVTNFATDYLIKPSSNSTRRRPGANMKSFVAMAREVKK